MKQTVQKPVEYIEFNPMRSPKEVFEHLQSGHHTFGKITDCHEASALWVNEIKVEAMVSANGDHRLISNVEGYFKSTCLAGGCFLGDTNADNAHNGGYNDHHLFLTKAEAERYMAHVKAGGKRLKRCPVNHNYKQKNYFYCNVTDPLAIAKLFVKYLEGDI